MIVVIQTVYFNNISQNNYFAIVLFDEEDFNYT